MDGCKKVVACCGQTIDSSPSSEYCYYDADGKRFQYNSSNISSVAQRVVDYCKSKKSLLCTVDMPGAGQYGHNAFLIIFGAIMSLGLLRRIHSAVSRFRRTSAAAGILAVGVGGCVAETQDNAEGDVERSIAAESAENGVEAIRIAAEEQGVAIVPLDDVEKLPLLQSVSEPAPEIVRDAPAKK